MFCPKCGNQQPDGTRFCGVCGAPLPTAPTGRPVDGTPTPGPFAPPVPQPVPAMGAQGSSVRALVSGVLAILSIVFINLPWMSVSGFGVTMDMTVGQANDYVGRLASMASSFGSSANAEVAIVTFFLGLVNVLCIVATILCVVSAAVRVASLIPSPDVQGIVAKVPFLLHVAAGAVVCLAAMIWLAGLIVASEGLEALEVVGYGTYLALVSGAALAVLSALAKR